MDAVSRRDPVVGRLDGPSNRSLRNRGLVVADPLGGTSGWRTGRRACRIGHNAGGGAARRRPRHGEGTGQRRDWAGGLRRASTGSTGGAASSASRPRWPARRPARTAWADPQDEAPGDFLAAVPAGRPW